MFVGLPTARPSHQSTSSALASSSERRRAYEVQVKAEARKIREKYLHPDDAVFCAVDFLVGQLPDGTEQRQQVELRLRNRERGRGGPRGAATRGEREFLATVE